MCLMGKPQQKVKIKWSPEFAYAIGLLTTDGNLSTSGRHIVLVSNDREQIMNLKKCLGITNKISKHVSGTSGSDGFHIQFGDVVFYKFLVGLGIHPNKSKTIQDIAIPKNYFFDFLRGHFDGDGSFYSYFDKRWRSSFMFYLTFVSASKNHISWIQDEICNRLEIRGHITKARSSSVYQLKYAKADSLKLLPKLYYDSHVVCLSRKRNKIEKATGLKLVA